MAKTQRLYDFQNGTRTNAEQVDDEFDNLIRAHNDLDDEVKQKVDVKGDFQGTWNGIPFEEADPAIAGRVTAMENMVKEEEKVTVTLKRGENIIEAPENASLVPLEILGDEVKNLALDFDHWTLHANAVKNSSDKVTLNAAAPNEASTLKITVKRNQDYVYSMKHTGAIAVLDASLNVIVAYTDQQFIKFNSGNNDSVHIAFKNKNDDPGTFTFEGRVLVEGTVERESVQNYQPVRGPYIEVDNGSYLYFDEYLYKGDKLYQNGQGNWRKKQNKIESLLTLENVKTPTINSSYTGGKGIKIPLNEIAKGIDIYDTELIKFNHTFITKTDSAANITNDRYFMDNTDFILFASTTETGWGDDVTPSKQEILAFIQGWKMAHNNGTVPYKEADSATNGAKKWIRLIGEGESTALPQESYFGWNPLKLIYKTVSEQDVPAKHEGSLRLVKGTNKATLGEGVVLREKATPVLSGNNYVIGDLAVSGSETKYKIDNVIEVSKRGKKDNWTIGSNAQQDKSLHYPLALYEITYKVKDKFAYSCNIGDTQSHHTINFHMEGNEQVKDIQEIKNALAQIGLNVINRLGVKDGIALLGSDGSPLRADGKSALITSKQFRWKVASTDNVMVTKNGGTYTKRIPIDGIEMTDGFEIALSGYNTTTPNDHQFNFIYSGSIETLKTGRAWVTNNSTYSKFLVPFSKDVLDVYPSIGTGGHGANIIFAAATTTARIKQIYFDKENTELVIVFHNTNTTTDVALVGKVILEVWGI
ncbi:hypothetical protein RRV45_15090 [Bacillus sp. DTU_2020_1000418_1_SI_GHA_SEK_038]|uniref:hypothetical protein n=1 Tax=Bacillus sp. DTU_2020_1000418_1_SI_GHA_SEK_038 TaxID=3077585 RepID=UPI0028E8FDCF|nr:hypothetical protein [Bacillus sp. DTU_2020_1000418_1_SI_GHA_SEK_038]WNS74234.1 hypothetical protein RRV45_15090 [Bacillus sp. DTU_2020_1000418_1_SI_GHA_SEK_038]